MVAPDAAEAHLARQLEAEEAGARDDARLTMSDDGRGRTHGRFTLPTLQAQMLHKHLMALASPRRDGADPGPERRPLPQRLGRAFLEYVERYPASATPDAGGVAATVVVTMSLDSLLGGDARSHPRHRRRDLRGPGPPPGLRGRRHPGRARRRRPGRSTSAGSAASTPRRSGSHSALQQGGCTADGCDWPPGMCHAHHDVPWHRGGHTDVEDRPPALPAPPRAASTTRRTSTQTLPNGAITFHRRT